MDIPSRELEALVRRGALEGTAGFGAPAGRQGAARVYPLAGPPR